MEDACIRNCMGSIFVKIGENHIIDFGIGILMLFFISISCVPDIMQRELLHFMVIEAATEFAVAKLLIYFCFALLD
jgi:hypothetical protein